MSGIETRLYSRFEDGGLPIDFSTYRIIKLRSSTKYLSDQWKDQFVFRQKYRTYILLRNNDSIAFGAF